LQVIWYILTDAYAVYPLLNFNTGNGGVIHYQMLTTVATKIISHDSAAESYIMYYNGYMSWTVLTLKLGAASLSKILVAVDMASYS